MRNNWEIIDNNGVIHSGTEEEMRTAWKVMISGGTDKNSDEEIRKYACDWNGDLKLVEVHEIFN